MSTCPLEAEALLPFEALVLVPLGTVHAQPSFESGCMPVGQRTQVRVGSSPSS